MSTVIASKPKILLLNDDESLLETRRRLFEAHGAEVLTGCGTRESIQTVLGTAADLVLIDATNVGFRHGEFICDAVKQIRPEQRVAILLTPETDVPDRTRADHVIFRTGPRRILAEVNELLANRLTFKIWEADNDGGSNESDTGLVTRWFGTNTEIDELQRTREELREKSELIELAQAAVNAGYWSYFPDTGECFLSQGEQALLGLGEKARPTLGEIIERVYEADRENVLGAMQEGMESGAYFAEFRIQKDDGTIRWVAGQGRVVIKDDGGKYMVGINFDVTNQKLAEDALRKSEKLAVACRLAATISHEINNPLESVTNLLYILRSSTNEEQTRQYVMTAEEELARVTHIVTHSLRFHRSSTAPTYEKLSTILESVAGIYKNRLLLDHIEIKRDYRDQNLVRCYLSELRQVFGNLIGNAFDAIKNGGFLYLRSHDAIDASTGHAGVRVTVADSGHGMDARTLQRLFEPFFTTKGDNGTGFGLWICKGILNKHHCKVRVRSRSGSYRSGTVFSIFFPLNAIEEPTETPSELATGAPNNGVASRAV